MMERKEKLAKQKNKQLLKGLMNDEKRVEEGEQEVGEKFTCEGEEVAHLPTTPRTTKPKSSPVSSNEENSSPDKPI